MSRGGAAAWGCAGGGVRVGVGHAARPEPEELELA
jgi:hypothetical protein